jgi:guanylate kinase
MNYIRNPSDHGTDIPSSAPDFDVYHPETLLIVISGPSGVGKDSVITELRRRNLPLQFVVTATSREPRPNEIEGIDYVFVSTIEFEQMIENHELIEHAMVYGQYKGVPLKHIQNALDSGKDAIMRVDVQGARRIKRLFPEAVMIFLIPDNFGTWYQRLANRNTETPDSLAVRFKTAKSEMDCLNEFDYVVINAEDRLTEAVDMIENIIHAEHHRIPHRKINL